MKTFYKLPFKRFVKKQARPLQLSIEDEIERIIENPAIGEIKKGDLKGFRVHKFSFKKQKLLKNNGVDLLRYFIHLLLKWQAQRLRVD